MVYGGGGYGPLNYGYGKIVSATKEDDYIYIFDKFVYERHASGGAEIAFYRSSDKSDYIGLLGIDFNIEINSTTSEKMDTLYNNLNVFKHTFKKDKNGDYYWISTEKNIEK